MNIYRLIYTKFGSKEDSPYRKSGQHTAFYSHNFLEEGDLGPIERWANFPSKKAWSEKDIVFYQKIQNQICLVILNSRYLPEARDHAGRTGIYLCQGFIFPYEVWNRVQDPSLFGNWLRQNGKILSTREEVLSSPETDPDSGNYKPILVSLEMLETLAVNFPTINDKEFEIVNAMIHCCEEDDCRPVFLKGSTEKVSSTLSRLVKFLPDEIKLCAGWDPDFRKDGLEEHPARVIGVGTRQPLAKNPVLIDLDQDTLNQDMNLEQQHSYSKWVELAKQQILNPGLIEEAYQLSRLVDRNENPKNRDFSNVIQSFIKVNQDQIAQALIRRFQTQWKLGGEFSRQLAARFDSFEQMNLLINQLPIERFVRPFEELLFESFPEEPLPQEIIDKGTGRLFLLGQVQQGKALTTQDLKGLDDSSKRQFVGYLLSNYWEDKDWVLDLVGEDLKTLDRLLANGGFKLEQIEKLQAWIRGQSGVDKDLNYIRSFFFPEDGVADEVGMNDTSRQRLIETLIRVHGYRQKDAEGFGISLDDWTAVENRLGVKPNKGFIKKLFG